MPNNPVSADIAADAETLSTSSPAVPASVVVLVEDTALLEVLKQAVQGRHRVWRADDIVHAADLLVAAPYAVLLLDAALTGHRTTELIGRLHQQFSDLPIVVTGRLDDEVELGPLISGGIIFRFLHKPVSVERTRNFIEAAVRRLGEAPAQGSAGHFDPQLPKPPRPAMRLPRISLSRRFVRRSLGIGAVLLVLALLGWGISALIERAPWKDIHFSLPDRAARPDPTPGRSAVDRLLDAAGVALSQGRLIEPEGRNAVELYRAALARDPANVQARLGLTQVADRFLQQVEQALLTGDLATAASALDAARSADPDHPRLGFLSAQIEQDSRQRQQAAMETASGRAAGEQALEQRVTALLAVADQRIRTGKLIGGLDSAEAYVLEARQAAPDDPRVRQGLNAFSAALLLKSRQAWSDGNEVAARNWLQRVQALGVDPEGVARLGAEMASAQVATVVEDRSRLLALANQRLAQGRLLQPDADSARHYLDLLRAADPAFPGTAETQALLASRLLEQAKRAAGDDRAGDAERYLDAARAAGASNADLAAAGNAVSAASAAAASTRTAVPESTLKRISGAPPAYPARAESQGTEGWVEVEFTVTASGTTRDAVVRNSSPPGLFDDAVLDAVQRWRYEPRMMSGQPVDQRVLARLRFRLAGR